MKLLALLLCAAMVGQKPAKKHPLIEGNVTQNVWNGQSDSSSFAFPPKTEAVSTSGISMAYPLVTNHWADCMVPEFKAGTILYVAPWPKLPIPEALRK